MKNHLKSLEYAVHIVVIVLYRGKYRIFATEKEIWILDYHKYSSAYSIVDDASDRLNILILSDVTFNALLPYILEYEISSTDIRNYISTFKKPFSFDDIVHLMPVLYIDFDNKNLYSIYPEPMGFENFAPDDWQSKYEEFYDKIPSTYNYWDDFDM
jgi:hypothetical protein